MVAALARTQPDMAAALRPSRWTASINSSSRPAAARCGSSTRAASCYRRRCRTDASCWNLDRFGRAHPTTPRHCRFGTAPPSHRSLLVRASKHRLHQSSLHATLRTRLSSQSQDFQGRCSPFQGGEVLCRAPAARARTLQIQPGAWAACMCIQMCQILPLSGSASPPAWRQILSC